MASQPDGTVSQLVVAFEVARGADRAYRDREIARQLEAYRRVVEGLSHGKP
jgi:hypothetical protein